MWHSSDGKDIAYTGASAASLPIEVKVTYRYNGSYITPKELLGKSGHVVIRYDYINHSQVTVNGSQVYTPFVAITGLLLDNEIFSNVKVTNGRLIEDSDRTIAIGYAMPGLASSLDAGDDLEVPEYFEIEADAKDFELKSALTIASPDMLTGFDTSDLDTSEYSNASSGLTSAMSELTSGSSELTDGLNQISSAAAKLSSGATELDSGMSQAESGMPALITGIGSLHDGSTQIAAGTYSLTTGLMDLQEGTEQVQGGMSQLASALSSDSIQQLVQVMGASQQELAGDLAAIGQMQAAAGNTASAISNASDSYQSLQSNVTGYLASTDLTEEQQAEVASLFASSQVSENLSAAANAAAGIQDASASISTTYTEAAQGALASADFSQLRESVSAMASALDGIVSGQSKLAGAASQLSDGAYQLDAGIGELEAKANDLSLGMGQLASGASQISQGTSQLTSAIDAAAQGSSAMTEGLQTFNDEGISKIVDAIDNKLVKLANRFTAVTDAGGAYTNFGGITSGTTGSVKFVFETAAIEE